MTVAASKSEAADVKQLRSNERKWTKPLIEAGWTCIPSIIIEKQAALGLDPLDMNIIVHLAQYWWQADNLPHPSVERIAASLGVKPRTIQKRIRALHAAKMITRSERRRGDNGNDTNHYSFEGLIAAAQPFAKEKLVEKAKAIEEKKKRLERKKPKLVVDNSEM
jgi:DNA-binding transcriptional regulator YhcF (GntR family)